MSQVQIRQLPLATSTDAQRIVGSWFPTSYYGHFRAKSRADLCSHFRQLAQPVPPKRFLARQNAEATTHLFSQHDNRFKFECDPLVRGAQSGYGKRRSETNSRGEFDPLFISWVPINIDRKKFIDDVKTTSYVNDYNRDSSSSQILSDVQSTNSMPSSDVSTYSAVYKHGQPNNQQSKQIRQETFQRFSSTRSRRSQLQRIERSESVASCLVWNNAGSENQIANTNDTMINIAVPIKLRSRANSHDTSSVNQQKPYASQSLPTFKTMERPGTSAKKSRDNYNVKVIPPIRAAGSFEHTHTNSMECLISKYM